MNIPQIHSITKKLFVALLGGFLLIFLLFHMVANLLILCHDEGAAYTAFCHFMGTNIIVRLFEVVLMGCLLLHILLTAWLWVTNRSARPKLYHHKPRTKTAKGSTVMLLTGILIIVFLGLHFYDFYFVRLGIVKGQLLANGEPDFYAKVRFLFSHPQVCVGHWVFFAILGIHLRHAFASAFQTLGLYNHQYGKAIEVIAIIYTWVVCLGFAIVPLGILLGW